VPSSRLLYRLSNSSRRPSSKSLRSWASRPHSPTTTTLRNPQKTCPPPSNSDSRVPPSFKIHAPLLHRRRTKAPRCMRVPAHRPSRLTWLFRLNPWPPRFKPILRLTNPNPKKRKPREKKRLRKNERLRNKVYNIYLERTRKLIMIIAILKKS